MRDTDRDDDARLSALTRGEEQVSQDVERWSGVMPRLALSHVASRAIAEEVEDFLIPAGLRRD